MGQDISLIISPFDFYAFKAEQEDQEIFFLERNSLISLLPLLCFRYYDLKIVTSEENDVSRENLMPELRYVVPTDIAVKQLISGVAVLKYKFARASIIDRHVSYFIELLTRHPAKYLHMRFMDFAHMMEFDLLLHHALLGIQYPDMKMYYSPDQIQRWDYWQKPAENGIMSWSGALRRLTEIGTESSPDEEELFIPSDTNGGYFDLCILGFYPSGPL